MKSQTNDETLTYSVVWSRKRKTFEGRCEQYPKLSFFASDREKSMQGIQNLVSNLSKDDEMRELLVDNNRTSKQLLMENGKDS